MVTMTAKPTATALPKPGVPDVNAKMDLTKAFDRMAAMIDQDATGATTLPATT